MGGGDWDKKLGREAGADQTKHGTKGTLDFILKIMGSFGRFWKKGMRVSSLHLARTFGYRNQTAERQNLSLIAQPEYWMKPSVPLPSVPPPPATFSSTHTESPFHSWSWIKRHIALWTVFKRLEEASGTEDGGCGICWQPTVSCHGCEWWSAG